MSLSHFNLFCRPPRRGSVMLTMLILIAVTSLVKLIPLIDAASSTTHSLFHKIYRQNSTLVQYSHRIMMHNAFKLPCRMPPGAKDVTSAWFDELTYGDSSLFTYQWLINGQPVSPTGIFLSGQWDRHGNLIVLDYVARPLTVWCIETTRRGLRIAGRHHVQLQYAHELHFYTRPLFHQVIGFHASISSELRLTRDFDFCTDIDLNCDCSVPRDIVDSRKQWFTKYIPSNRTKLFEPSIFRDVVMKTAWQYCINKMPETCLAIAFMDHQCLITYEGQERINQDIFVQFSVYYSLDRKVIDYSSVNSMKLAIEQAVNNAFAKSRKRAKAQLMSRTTAICLGTSGQLINDALCDPCSVGSFKLPTLINPGPPTAWNYSRANLHPSFDDRETDDNRYLRRPGSYYIDRDLWYDFNSSRLAKIASFKPDKRECLPCPFNHYTEEVGRPECLSCPQQHRRQRMGHASRQFGTDWLHTACAKSGRRNVLFLTKLYQYLGANTADWMGARSLLGRALLLAYYLSLPLVFGAFLMLCAYLFVDVGQLLLDMAVDFRRMHIQLAQLAVTTASLKHEQIKMAEAEIKAKTKKSKKKA